MKIENKINRPTKDIDQYRQNWLNRTDRMGEKIKLRQILGSETKEDLGEAGMSMQVRNRLICHAMK
jgi:hypothetical protein